MNRKILQLNLMIFKFNFSNKQLLTVPFNISSGFVGEWVKIENEIEYLYEVNGVRFTIADNMIKTVISSFFLASSHTHTHLLLFFRRKFYRSIEISRLWCVQKKVPSTCDLDYSSVNSFRTNCCCARLRVVLAPFEYVCNDVWLDMCNTTQITHQNKKKPCSHLKLPAALHVLHHW